MNSHGMFGGAFYMIIRNDPAFFVIIHIQLSKSEGGVRLALPFLSPKSTSWKRDFWVLPFYTLFQMVINNSYWSFHSKLVESYQIKRFEPSSRLTFGDSMTTEEVKRKLTAILNADVKGYSRLMGKIRKILGTFG